MDESTDSSLFEPSEAFTEALLDQVNRADVSAMVQRQREMLSRYEKTNEMLINFNMLSSSRFEVTSHEYRKHTLLLSEMKKDLDQIFRRIRALKKRLGKMYPEAFSACSDVFNLMEDDEDRPAPAPVQPAEDEPSTSSEAQKRHSEPASGIENG